MAAELPKAGMVALCVAIGKAMAAELPEADTVALCLTIGKAMAAVLPEAGMAALCLAFAIPVGCRVILKPLLHFLEGSPARGRAMDAAVFLVVLAIVMAYLAAVILLFAPAASAPVFLVAFGQYLLLVCAPLVLLSVSFLFLAAGGW